ncbi:MAG: hypothetical protein JW937_04010 [Candidatus Omnitrophica bacterium]|nr:hypothetical protein [Candidatus Omnitrophota bacterium]
MKRIFGFLLSLFLILLVSALGMIALPLWQGPDLWLHLDHPVRLHSLWFLLRDAAPVYHAIGSWSPYFMGGWPVLQFYPPGYAYIAVLIDLLSAKSLSIEWIYYLLLVVVYLLPAWTSYWFSRCIGLNRAVSAWAAVLILIFRDPVYMGSDVRGALEMGMLNGRISLALYPLAAACAVRAAQSVRPFWSFALTGAVLGAVAVTHPWHFPLAVVAVLTVFAWQWGKFHNLRGSTGVLWVLWMGLISLGLAAHWLFPAMAYKDLYMRSVHHPWSFVILGSWVKGMGPVLVLYALALAAVYAEKDDCKRRTWSAILTIPPLMALLSLVNYYLFYRVLGLDLFEPIKFKDDIYMATLLVSGIGLKYLADLLLGLSRQKPVSISKRAWTWVVLVVCSAGLWTPYLDSPLQRRLAPGDPFYYSSMERSLRLDALWEVLRGGKGRLLTSAVTVRHAGSWSHLYALIPQYTGREVIGGLRGHMGPVMSAYLYGDAAHKISDTGSKSWDQILLGTSFEPEEELAFVERCGRLRVSQVLVHDREIKALAFFTASPFFVLESAVGPFRIFALIGQEPLPLPPGLVDVQVGTHGFEARIPVPLAKAATWVPGMAYHPDWCVEMVGAPVPTRMTSEGLLQVEVPAGIRGLLQGAYVRGPWEIWGLRLTWGTLVLLLISAIAGLFTHKDEQEDLDIFHKTAQGV